jgi:hypothetical protein
MKIRIATATAIRAKKWCRFTVRPRSGRGRIVPHRRRPGHAHAPVLCRGPRPGRFRSHSPALIPDHWRCRLPASRRSPPRSAPAQVRTYSASRRSRPAPTQVAVNAGAPANAGLQCRRVMRVKTRRRPHHRKIGARTIARCDRMACATLGIAPRQGCCQSAQLSSIQMPDGKKAWKAKAKGMSWGTSRPCASRTRTVPTSRPSAMLRLSSAET